MNALEPEESRPTSLGGPWGRTYSHLQSRVETLPASGRGERQKFESAIGLHPGKP